LPLEFEGNAICLSGGTGTQLKSEVLGSYYPFWWKITSGGDAASHAKPTTIVDLNAGTGEVYLKDSKTKIFGSAGHALKLKLDGTNTQKLKLVLVEDNEECYVRLKRNIIERWPNFNVKEGEGPIDQNSTGVYLVRGSLNRAVPIVGQIGSTSPLGRSIFLFDPLRIVEWSAIDTVARQRIPSFYKIGTEFIIFLFTSDLFLGRNDFSPLPTSLDNNKWTKEESQTVDETDALFGYQSWRQSILRDGTRQALQERLVELYKLRLHSWFRYVLPLPFAPKKEQLYHLFCCSNFEVGIRATRNSFFCPLTGNQRYGPDMDRTYMRFGGAHPTEVRGFQGRDKPLVFRILWKTIKEHEEGYCDVNCQDIIKLDRDRGERRKAIEWLYEVGYLQGATFSTAWGLHPPSYMLNWNVLKDRLGVSAPKSLTPLIPGPGIETLASFS